MTTERSYIGSRKTWYSCMRVTTLSNLCIVTNIAGGNMYNEINDSPGAMQYINKKVEGESSKKQ